MLLNGGWLDDHRDREFFLLLEQVAAFFAAPVFCDDITELQAQQAEYGIAELREQRIGQIADQVSATHLIADHGKVAYNNSSQRGANYAPPITGFETGENRAFVPQQLQRDQQ